MQLTETDDKMRAFAEKVFASETKDENVRDEISMFDVDEDCPIMHEEMAHHLHTEDNAEKRWDRRWLNSINLITSMFPWKHRAKKTLYSW